MRSERPTAAGGPTPKVSVVIATLNGETTLPDSLGSALTQTFSDFEVVLADDGSSDQSRAIAEELLNQTGTVPWTILNLSGLGPAGARNRAIKASRGELVAFLDDDDSWSPEKLARCVPDMEERALDLVCHSEYWVTPEGKKKTRRYRDLFNHRVAAIVSLLRNNPLSTSAVVVRRQALLEAGLFDESLPSAEDYDLWIRLAMMPNFRIGFIDEPLGTYLVREGSESSKVDRRHQALLEIGRRYRENLQDASPLGALEYWIYLARVDLTTGVRYFQLGQRIRGLGLALRGVIRWPLRFDWLALSIRELLRRDGSP